MQLSILLVSPENQMHRLNITKCLFIDVLDIIF